MDKKIDIVPYADKDRDTWEWIVKDSNNGTLYHTQKFLEYHPKGRFNNFHHIIAVDGNACCAVPGCIAESEKGKTFVSYSGASVGGFVLPEDFGLEDTDRVICAFLDYLKGRGFCRIEITLPPIFYGRRQNNHADFILSREGFGFKKREVSSVIALNYPDDDILKTFEPSARRSVKKATTSGVEVMADDSETAYRDYYKILEKNLNLRHNVKPVHTVEEMMDIKRRFPEEVFLFTARHSGRIIGGIWLFKINRDVSVAFYISHDQEYQELRPINLLYYETIRKTVSWKQKYFELGLFTVNMAPNYGLGRFKESFGAQGLFRDYFRKDLAV
jgi:hypothetical protein